MEKKVMKGRAFWKTKGGKEVQEPRPDVRSCPARQTSITAGAIMAVVLLVGAMAAPLSAQPYPARPIRFILPFAPGGGADIVGRTVAPMLSERLGQPFVCENRAGAGGNVGLEFVAKARPDGYTLLLTSASITISPSLYKKLNYDPIKDFATISRVAQIHILFLVHPSLPVKTLKELVEYARTKPGKLNYGSSGVGSPAHLAGELFKSLTKTEFAHIAYKSVGAAIIGLVSGEVDMMVANTAAAMPQVQGGKARALAVLSSERLPSLPDVPTAKEAGIENYEVMVWYGLLAPAGTPRDLVNRLNAEWVKIAAMPDTREKMQKAGGVEPLSDTPEQFSEFLKTEIGRWARVIKEANIPTID